jgi:hypothetical protein
VYTLLFIPGYCTVTVQVTVQVDEQELGMISVAVSVTRCIVTCPPPLPGGRAAGSLVALVVPANEQLVGTQFAYFPQVAGTKEVGAQPSWGGADITSGGNMFYPVQVVDGVVAQQGGTALRELCAALPVVSDSDVRCPVGRAVSTRAPSHLGEHFDRLVHVVAPLWGDEGDESQHKSSEDQVELVSAYDSVFEHASGLPPSSVLLCPLLGCGARGAPADVSIAAAVQSLQSLRRAADLTSASPSVPDVQLTVHFALQDPELANSLKAELVTVGLL